MIHRTYRSLDAPVRLLGFTWGQWLGLITGGGGLIALVHFLHVPTRPAISFCTLAIGVPLALAYLAEETGLGVGRLLLDMARWRLRGRAFEPGLSPSRVGFVVRAEP